jgi:hypothetical protein
VKAQGRKGTKARINLTVLTVAPLSRKAVEPFKYLLIILKKVFLQYILKRAKI